MAANQWCCDLFSVLLLLLQLLLCQNRTYFFLYLATLERFVFRRHDASRWALSTFVFYRHSHPKQSDAEPSIGWSIDEKKKKGFTSTFTSKSCSDSLQLSSAAFFILHFNISQLLLFFKKKIHVKKKKRCLTCKSSAAVPSQAIYICTPPVYLYIECKVIVFVFFLSEVLTWNVSKRNVTPSE